MIHIYFVLFQRYLHLRYVLIAVDSGIIIIDVYLYFISQSKIFISHPASFLPILLSVISYGLAAVIKE